MLAKDTLNSAILAVGISLTITLIINLVWAMFQTVHVDGLMASPERMLKYTQIEEEAPLQTDTDLIVNQPSIEFTNVTLKYDQDREEIALRDVNFTVQPCEKVGIVGRTGAGKSSIMVTLFRMTELTSGHILIGNQDISQVGLHSLRSQISVIP